MCVGAVDEETFELILYLVVVCSYCLDIKLTL